MTENNKVTMPDSNISINSNGKVVNINKDGVIKSVEYAASNVNNGTWLPYISINNDISSITRNDIKRKLGKLFVDGENTACVVNANSEYYLFICYKNTNMVGLNTSYLKLQQSSTTTSAVAIKINSKGANANDVAMESDGLDDYEDKTFYLDVGELPEDSKFSDGSEYDYNMKISNLQSNKWYYESSDFKMGKDIYKNRVIDIESDLQSGSASTETNITVKHTKMSNTKYGAVRITDSNGNTRFLCSTCSISCNLKCSENSTSDITGCVICGNDCTGTCALTCEGGGMAITLFGKSTCMAVSICIIGIIAGQNSQDVPLNTGFNALSCGLAKCGLTCENTCGLECSAYCYGSCTSGCGLSCKTSCEVDSGCNYYASNGTSFSVDSPDGEKMQGNSYKINRKMDCKWCRNNLLLFPL